MIIRRIEKFKIDNDDKQLKNLAQRLATILKETESSLRPKLDPDMYTLGFRCYSNIRTVHSESRFDSPCTDFDACEKSALDRG